MYINSIYLKNYRNHSELNLEFKSKTNLIIGRNGSGKTSILEAINSVSTTKSFRAQREIDTIQHDKKFSKINIDYFDDVENKLEILNEKISDSRCKKVYKVNEISKSNSFFIGKLITILFSSDILNGFPEKAAIRRKVFNSLLCQIDKEYLFHLNELNKVIKNKNAALKMVKIGVEKNILNYWNQELIKNSSVIIKKRIEFVNILNKFILESNKDNKIELYYLSKDIDNNSIEMSEIRKQLTLKMNSITDTEIITSRCLFGAQRDDFEMTFNSRKIRDFASRGEQKLSVLTLLYSIANLVTEITSKNPILLIDDLYSEMDMNNFRYSLDLLLSGDFQMIITTIDKLPYKFIKNMETIKLN